MAVKRPWFNLDPIDEELFETVPQRLVDSFEIPLPAERVWGDLTCKNPMPWCRILQRIDWTSPRPFGVGTTRTTRALGGLVVLRERFFRWEEGRRYSFFVEEASLPAVRRHAEDFLVEPASESSCRFTWTVAIELRRGAGIGRAASRLSLGTAFRDTRKHYRSPDSTAP